MTTSPTALRIAELQQSVGRELGVTAWTLIDQPQVDAFAEVTHDEQWIHCDPERAAAGPFGATIAHGFLTLSHCAGFMGELIQVTDAALSINYGLNRVRFPAPVLVGTRIRGRASITAVEPIEGGAQAVITMTIEGEHSSRPVCVAELVARYMAPVAGG